MKDPTLLFCFVNVSIVIDHPDLKDTLTSVERSRDQLDQGAQEDKNRDRQWRPALHHSQCSSSERLMKSPGMSTEYPIAPCTQPNPCWVPQVFPHRQCGQTIKTFALDGWTAEGARLASDSKMCSLAVGRPSHSATWKKSSETTSAKIPSS